MSVQQLQGLCLIAYKGNKIKDVYKLCNISKVFGELIKDCWRIFRLEKQLVNCIFRLQSDIIVPHLSLQKAIA